MTVVSTTKKKFLNSAGSGVSPEPLVLTDTVRGIHKKYVVQARRLNQRTSESKERIGGRVKRKYSRAKTPYRRLIESDQISVEEKKKLTAIYESLNPAKLKRIIDKKLDNLFKIYQKKKDRENISITTNKLNPSLVSFSKMAQEEVLVS